MSFLDDLKKVIDSNGLSAEEMSFASFKDMAANKLTQDKQLTEEAKREADAHNLDQNAYKNILLSTANKQVTSFKKLLPLVKSAYQSGVVSLDKLIAQKDVHVLAPRYHRYKDELGAEMLHMNPGGIEEDYKELPSDEAAAASASEWKVVRTKTSTTFAHALFANRVPKDDIVIFFQALDKLIGKNQNLSQAYMGLSDTRGVSVLELLREQNLVVGYEGIYDEVREKCRSGHLFPNEQRNAAEVGVDTHTGSIHGSVDMSFASLAQGYDSSRVKLAEGSNRDVLVTRDEEWDEGIGAHLESLKGKLSEIIKDDGSLVGYLKPTLSPKDNLEVEKEKFRFQVQTALRMLDGLEQHSFGSTLKIQSRGIVSCGLNPREIVAIGYHSLSDKKNWTNPQLEREHFMYFVKNMYVAMRGYNIDRHGVKEYLTHSDEADDNKCVGGTVNQLAVGLQDHKNVKVSIINTSTMKGPMMSGALVKALNTLSEGNEDIGREIIRWFNEDMISQEMVDGVVGSLIKNKEFTQEFSEGEIKQFAPKVIRSLSELEKKKIKGEVSALKKSKTVERPIDSFTFDDEQGYILSVEDLYRKDKKRYGDQVSGFLPQLFSGQGLDRKNNMNIGIQLLNCLLLSPNTEFVRDVSEKCNAYFFSQENRRELVVLDAAIKLDCVGVIRSILDSPDISSEIVNNQNFVAKALHKALELRSIKSMRVILHHDKCTPEVLNAESDFGQTALVLAIHYGNADMVREILRSPHCTPGMLNIKDGHGQTMLAVAVDMANGDVVREILKSPHCTPEVLNVVDSTGRTVLGNAVGRGYVDIAKHILESPRCTTKLLNMKDIAGNTALTCAADKCNRDIVSAILESPHCTPEILNAVNGSGQTALILAMSRVHVNEMMSMGYEDVINSILSSRHCTAETLNAQNSRGDTALILAVNGGNTDLISAILSSRHCTTKLLNMKDIAGNTALILSINGGDADILSVILASEHCTQDTLNAKNNNGNTALILGASVGDKDIVDAILASEHCTQKTLNAKNKSGETALTWAAGKGNTDLVSAILASPHCTKEMLNAKSVMGQTVLASAVERGNADMISAILASPNCTPETLNARGDSDDTALIWAAGKGNRDIVDAILASDHCTPEMLNARGGNDDTALICAARGGNRDIVDAILASDHCTPETLNAKNNNGNTALTLAASVGNRDIVSAILASRHCTPEMLNARNSITYTALIWAASVGDKDIVDAILASRHCTAETLNAQNIKGETALIIALKRGNTDLISAILASPNCTPETLNAKDNSGDTALIFALKRGNADILKEILASDHCTEETLNAKNDSGETALIHAAAQSNADMISAILASRYCTEETLNAKNNNGDTALIFAIKRGNTDLISAILANPHCTPETLNLGNSISALDGCTAETFRMQDKDGNTLLHKAILSGKEFAVKAVLDSPHFPFEVIFDKNKEGHTPKDLAFMRGDEELGERMQSIIDARTVDEKTWAGWARSKLPRGGKKTYAEMERERQNRKGKDKDKGGPARS